MPANIDDFKRQFASGGFSQAQPWPPFPSVPTQITDKFPDLTPFWDAYEKAIAEWIKAVQTR